MGSYGQGNHPIATKLGTGLHYHLRDNISILKGTTSKAGVSGNASCWHVLGSYGQGNHPIVTKLGTGLHYHLRNNISIFKGTTTKAGVSGKGVL